MDSTKTEPSKTSLDSRLRSYIQEYETMTTSDMLLKKENPEAKGNIDEILERVKNTWITKNPITGLVGEYPELEGSEKIKKLGDYYHEGQQFSSPLEEHDAVIAYLQINKNRFLSTDSNQDDSGLYSRLGHALRENGISPELLLNLPKEVRAKQTAKAADQVRDAAPEETKRVPLWRRGVTLLTQMFRG